MENELFLVRYYWSLLLKHPLRWLVPTLAIIAIGGVFVMQSPRSYLSVARVATQSPQVSNSLVQSTVTSERIQFFEQRVFSRENLVELADKLGLVPQRAGLTDGQVAEMVRQQITLQATPLAPNDPSSNAAILTIGFQADTPERAAAGANAVIQMLVIENRNARMSEASQVRTFLEQEAVARRQQAEGLEAEWNEFISTNEALLPSRLPLYTSEIQELQQELQTIQTASTSLAADMRVLETQLALASRTASREEAQLAALLEELSTKQTIYSDTHPEVLSLRGRIATLQANLTQMKAEPTASPEEQITVQSAERAMLNERVTAARQQQQDYSARRIQITERLDWLRTTIAEMPSVEANLLALQRRHTAAAENLADMQSRLDTAMVGERLENAQQDSQISIIDKPELPAYAVGSGRTRALLIVGALSLAVGIGSLVLLDFLDRTIKSKRDLASILEGGDLVLIPDWTPGKAMGTRPGLSAVIALLALAGLTATGYSRPPDTPDTGPDQETRSYS